MNAQQHDGDVRTASLGLTSVLVGSLPAELMTDKAPERYTVEAVFTRRPGKEEVLEVVGPQTRDALGRAGYPDVTLTVSDRRLEIGNTTLEELRDGLGAVIAARLADITVGVQDEQNAAASRARDVAATEHDRAEAVAALAHSVTFAPAAGDDATR